MAASQAPYSYASSSLEAIESQLSKKRFATYMIKAGHKRELAIELYLYNARLAKSLLFPLHILEVVLRNGIDDVISGIFGNDWHLDHRFRAVLSPQTNNTLQKALGRFRQTPKKDDLISQLTLDFWSNLFRPEYDRHLWQTHMPGLFPNHSITRSQFESEIMQLNRLRNRIAHHEPILHMNTSSDHHRILEIIGYRCPETSHWAKAHSTVPQMLRTKPKPSAPGNSTLGDRADPDFYRVPRTCAVSDLIDVPTRFFIATSKTGDDEAIFDHRDIGVFLLAKQDGGIIDFSEHHVGDLIDALGCRDNFALLSESESAHQLPSAFKKAIRFIGITQTDSPKQIIGIIAKAHRRY